MRENYRSNLNTHLKVSNFTQIIYDDLDFAVIERIIKKAEKSK